MIQSLFDTEETPEEEKNRDGAKVEDELIATAPVEISVHSEKSDENATAQTSGVSDKSEEPFDFDTEGDSILDLEPAATAETEAEFLKLEKELAKIEEEVRVEKDRSETPIFNALDKAKKPAARPPESEKMESESAAAGQTNAPADDQVAGQIAEPAAAATVEPQINTPVATEPAEAENQIDQNVALSPVVTPPEFPFSEEVPQSKVELIRQSGLAFTAATVLFGSIAFLLIIGWFADLLLGTSPWGVVGGIILGSIIGFFQFFRLTSQILKR